ncbi:tetratricopeptide repeat protein [Candidatus Sumerlaeota bacterium]|nr:tetratricopeptide repeat protein [Candidatus Sumerlaeota bacterium]MBI3735119.1 tetratricopeptide repeat protein [Candidatus Sumerlaeota bacterium]
MISNARRFLLLSLLMPALSACSRLPRGTDHAPLSSATAIEDGVALFKAGRLAQAQSAFEAELAAHPEAFDPVDYLGRIAFIKGRFDGAVERFERAAALAPGRADIYDFLGRSLGKVGAASNRIQGAVIAPKAKAAFEKAVALAPDNLQARQDLLHYYLEIQSNVGIGADRIQNQVDEIARRDAVEGRIAHGRVHEYHKEYDQAEKEYSEAVAARPGDIEARRRLGCLCNAIGKYPQAVASFEQLLKLDPHDVDARFQLGRASALSGEGLDRGEAMLHEYLKHEFSRSDEPTPDLHSAVWAHYWLGRIYERRGRGEEAASEYDLAMKINPGHAEIKKAQKELSRGKEKNPTGP